MQRQNAERVRREIIRLCHAGLDPRTLRLELIKQLRKVIPIDCITLYSKNTGESTCVSRRRA